MTLKRSRSSRRTASGVASSRAGPAEGVRHPVHEQRAVRQPGQGVVERLAGEALLDGAPLADVADGRRPRRDLVRVGDRPPDQLDRGLGPVREEGDRLVRGLVVDRELERKRGARRTPGRGSTTGAPRTSSGACPKRSAKARVDLEDPAVAVDHERLERGVGEAAQALRAGPQLLLGAGPGGQLGPCRGVEAGVLQGHGRELGEPAEAGHVGLVEDAAGVAGGKADDPDDLRARRSAGRRRPSRSGRAGRGRGRGPPTRRSPRRTSARPVSQTRPPTPWPRPISRPSMPRKMPEANGEAQDVGLRGRRR